MPKFTCKNILGRRGSASRYLSSKSLVSFHQASCTVRQQPWARVIHDTWCKSTKNMLKRSIWDMVIDFISHLLTWKWSLWLWPGTKLSSICYFHLNLRSGYAYQFIKINSPTYNITSIILTYLTSYFYSKSLSLFYTNMSNTYLIVSGWARNFLQTLPWLFLEIESHTFIRF